MSREILFKAKSIDSNTKGQWVEGFLFKSYRYFIGKGLVIVDCIEIEPLTVNDGCNIFSDCYCMVDTATVCEYTGKTDENGVKIFEGDILADPQIGLLGAVKYSQQYCRFSVFDVNVGEQAYAVWFSDCKVIGNIFDNPELLKSEDD